MTQGFYTIPDDWFINQIIRKFQAYVIVDIENKINLLLLTGIRDETFDERMSELMKKRTYYDRASKAQLLDELLTSARDRTFEEEICDAKVVFDLVLSKRQFGSFHEK